MRPLGVMDEQLGQQRVAHTPVRLYVGRHASVSVNTSIVTAKQFPRKLCSIVASVWA